MYYINCFFVYSFLGFFFESIVTKIMGNKFESGVMFGPYTPVYGFGVILIIVLSKYLFYNLHMPRWIETVIVFIVLFFTLTLLEWIGGIFIEKVFGTVFWDYSRFKFHIGHYIALEVSLAWAFLSILLIYFVHPHLDKFIHKIPVYLTYIFIIIFLIDTTCTILKYKFHMFQ